MIRMLIAVLALLGLSACTPTTTSSGYPENRHAANCFTGYHVFDLEVRVPAQYGQVLALTQHSNDASGLRPVCRLALDDDPIPGIGYPIYSGEVNAGQSGICVSARTSSGGHILSCASAAQVRRAVDAPLGSTASLIRLSQWQPYPSS